MKSKGLKYKKYKKGKLYNVYPHTHCPVCKRMVDNSDFGEFCSEDCAGLKQEKKKTKKKRIFYVVGGYILLFGVLIGITFLIN
jgi:predicted nucleic acid-binding Zn ribbon protein